ncbi:MAG: co-chaperone GroES [Patescibacteria group bacterium]
MKKKIQPLGDRVLVRPIVENESGKTASGIYLPDAARKEQSGEGEIIAVGEGRYENGVLIPMNVKIGDKVLFSKYAYEEVKIDGEDYYIFKLENILAVIK